MHFLSLAFLVIGTKLFLTLVPVAIKYTQANVWTIGIFRLIIACFFFTLLANRNFWHDFKKVWFVGPLFFAHWITYAMAVKVSTPSTAVIGLSSYGIILLLYARLFFKTRLTLMTIFCILCAFIGTFISIENFSLENNNFQGLMLGILSALTYALLPIVHQKFPFIPTKHKALTQFLGALIIFLIFGAPSYQFSLETYDYYALLYLAIGGTIIGHGLWVKVTETLSTTTTSAIYYLSLPIAMLLENLILDIQATSQKMLGASIVILSNILILYLRRLEKIKKPS
jgi:drug/metabolite transporter (DMT)-like permease